MFDASMLEDWYIKTVKLKHAFAGTTVPNPIPLPDVTNVDGMLEGIASESEEAFLAVAENAGIVHGETSAYKIQLPADVKRWYGLKKVGGRTIVWNQLNRLSQSSGTTNGVTYTLDTDTLTVACSGKASSNSNKSVSSYQRVSGHKYFLKGCPPGGSLETWYLDTSAAPDGDIGEGLVYTETSNNTGYIIVRVLSGVDATGVVFKPMLFDLTQMFGAGNEPSTAAECNAIFSADFYAHNTGELMNVGVTKVVSKKANNASLQTITIPNSIKNLAGYGMSCPGAYNYIDLEAKKFVQKVGSRAYASGDESDATVITDGTTTCYKLDTPVETSVTIADDIKHVDGGSITFENQLGADYGIPVYVDVRYIGL